MSLCISLCAYYLCGAYRLFFFTHLYIYLQKMNLPFVVPLHQSRIFVLSLRHHTFYHHHHHHHFLSQYSHHYYHDQFIGNNPHRSNNCHRHHHYYCQYHEHQDSRSSVVPQTYMRKHTCTYTHKYIHSHRETRTHTHIHSLQNDLKTCKHRSSPAASD